MNTYADINLTLFSYNVRSKSLITSDLKSIKVEHFSQIKPDNAPELVVDKATPGQLTVFLLK